MFEMSLRRNGGLVGKAKKKLKDSLQRTWNVFHLLRFSTFRTCDFGEKQSRQTGFSTETRSRNLQGENVILFETRIAILNFQCQLHHSISIVLWMWRERKIRKHFDSRFWCQVTSHLKINYICKKNIYLKETSKTEIRKMRKKLNMTTCH